MRRHVLVKAVKGKKGADICPWCIANWQQGTDMGENIRDTQLLNQLPFILLFGPPSGVQTCIG